MRFASFVVCLFAVAAGGCATHATPPVSAPPTAASKTAPSQIAGVWDAAIARFFR